MTCSPDHSTRAAGLLFMYVCVHLLCTSNRSKESCNRQTTESFRANCGYLQFTRFTAAAALLLCFSARCCCWCCRRRCARTFAIWFYIFANFKCIRPSLTVLACVGARAGQHECAKGRRRRRLRRGISRRQMKLQLRERNGHKHKRK